MQCVASNGSACVHLLCLPLHCYYRLLGHVAWCTVRNLCFNEDPAQYSTKDQTTRFDAVDIDLTALPAIVPVMNVCFWSQNAEPPTIDLQCIGRARFDAAVWFFYATLSREQHLRLFCFFKYQQKG